MLHSNENAAFTALAPLPFFWLAGFCLLYFIRAQIAGFRAVIPWSGLSKPKRWFVAFYFLSGAAALVMVAVVLMNQYVDTQVPVMLGYKMVTSTGPSNDYISVQGTSLPILAYPQQASARTTGRASGTWTRPDDIAEPLQTSQIECIKSQNRCTEAKAYVSGGSLFADVVDYDVASWTDNAIILRNDSDCSSEIYTIDLNTKSVTGAGHLTNQDQLSCQTMFKPAKSEWNYELADGFGVYWKAHQAALPLPLKLIQTLAGNN